MFINNPQFSGSGNIAQVVPLSYRNMIRDNGSFEVWQRGLSIAVGAASTAYTADRWYLKTIGDPFTVTQQPGLTNGSQFSGRVQRNAGGAVGGLQVFGYPLDSDQILAMRGSFLALTFNVSTGANWSPTNGTLNYNVYFGTGAVAKRGGGFTAETNPLTGSLPVVAGSIANYGIARSTYGVVVPTNATQAEIQFTWTTPAVAAGANDWVQLDSVQLEVLQSFDTNPTPFERLQLSESLQLCRSHYRTSIPYGTTVAQNAGVAGSVSIKNPIALGDPAEWIPFDPPMRTNPTFTTYNPSVANANWRNVTAAADVTVSVDPGAAKSTTGCLIATSGTVATLGDILCIHYSADSSI